jgi:prepilin-type N-terminal cleavage/methylation domain-containing protein
MRSLVNRKKAGLTLVELLIVISVIGVLVALLIPAVLAARESARKTECKNNLKQIALALHAYSASKHGYLPHPMIVPRSGSDGQRALSWRVGVLPFLEQQALFDSIDSKIPWDSGINKVAAGTIVTTFLCPNTPPDRMRIGAFSGGGTATRGGRTIDIPISYAPAVSDYQACSDTRFPGFGWIQRENVEGMPASLSDSSDDFFVRAPALSERTESFGRQPRMLDITDGMSNTVLLREWSESVTPFDIPLQRWTFSWMFGAEFHTFGNLGRTKLPVSLARAIDMTIGDVVWGTGAIHSGHDDGGFVAMCDASVKWVPYSLRVNEMTALFTREASDSGETYDQMLNAVPR